jgi:hypothetical protein
MLDEVVALSPSQQSCSLSLRGHVSSLEGRFSKCQILCFLLQQVAKEMLGNVALFCTYDLVLSLCGGSDSNGPGHGHPTGQIWLAIWPAGSLAGMAYYLVSGSVGNSLSFSTA